MLTSELRTAIPDIAISNAFDTQRLERIPYLSACIKEAIRFSLGVSARNPRVLTTPLTYDKWTIPSYTPVSMTIEDVHFDETIYKEAYEFQPERWLGDSPKALDGKPLEHYFVAFGKGPRACLGIKYVVLLFVLAPSAYCFVIQIALHTWKCLPSLRASSDSADWNSLKQTCRT